MQFCDAKILTERLILQLINHSFKEENFTEFTPEITKYMSPVPSVDEKVIIEFIDSAVKRLRDNSNLQLVLLKREDNSFVGCEGFHKTDTKTPELGIWIKKQHIIMATV